MRGFCKSLVEVKQVGQPRVVREAINQLFRLKRDFPDACGVVMAPYISPQAAEICIKEGVGFVDLAGNCRLSFDQVFISKEGKDNPFARKRDLRSLYSPKAERVLRVLLSTPNRWWRVQALAKEADGAAGTGKRWQGCGGSGNGAAWRRMLLPLTGQICMHNLLYACVAIHLG